MRGSGKGGGEEGGWGWGGSGGGDGEGQIRKDRREGCGGREGMAPIFTPLTLA